MPCDRRELRSEREDKRRYVMLRKREKRERGNLRKRIVGGKR